MANIKELKIEFQRSGHVHIDEIKIVRHAHHYPIEPDHSTEVIARLPWKIGAMPRNGGASILATRAAFFWRGQDVGGSDEAIPLKIQADVDTIVPDAWDQFVFHFQTGNE